ncbi:MAG: septal ring lytic transglycosylase RlpA family protein [Treponema sp.]|jgi:rare lipoprotein A|nr:septal ring lytic transglycosylase RlpA family protein [Treponema sp.]
MKYSSPIIAVFLGMAAVFTVSAQDVVDPTVNPFYGLDGYTGGNDYSTANEYPGVDSYYAAPDSPLGVPADNPVPQNAPSSGIFRQEGIASWYGAEFAGRPTASGALFNPAQFTAAHPRLPFGTLLKVTNRHNNRQAVVRVNDRGPYVSARIIDVSQAAAEALDMISTGTAPVLVEIAEGSTVTPPPVYQYTPAPLPQAASVPQAVPAPQAPQTAVPAPVPAYPYPPPAPAPAADPIQPVVTPPDIIPAVIRPALPPLGTGARYRVQVGSFKNTKNAVETFDRLITLGFQPNYERYQDFYRVVISGVPAEDMQMVAERLGAGGFREALIREEF